jgi:hypothetical protein
METEIEYNYDAIKRLQQQTNSNFNRVFICAYDINTTGKHPFLKYLLYKSDITRNAVAFPSIDISTTSQSVEFDKIVVMAQKYISIITMNTCIDTPLESAIRYQGSITYNTTDIYLFFDMTQLCSNNDEEYINDAYEATTFFCIIDEIMNTRKVFNNCVDESVSDFFLQNIDLIFLTDQQNKKYEIPKAFYVGTDLSLLHFTYVFGVSKTVEGSMFGPYYYFTDYDNCKTNNDGIVRFAVFLGKTLVKLNLPNDDIDESNTKRERLIVKEFKTYERNTMRITDYDGNWAMNYDSVYLGCIELDNGDFLQNAPIVAVKKYDQQISLSYWKTTIKDHL